MAFSTWLHQCPTESVGRSEAIDPDLHRVLVSLDWFHLQSFRPVTSQEAVRTLEQEEHSIDCQWSGWGSRVKAIKNHETGVRNRSHRRTPLPIERNTEAVSSKFLRTLSSNLETRVEEVDSGLTSWMSILWDVGNQWTSMRRVLESPPGGKLLEMVFLHPIRAG